MKCCGADLNHNLWLNLVIAALMGFSESIWTNTIGVAFIYDVWGGSNTKVGLATALTGVAAMLTAFPAGWAADRFRRSAVIRVGAVSILLAVPLYGAGVVGAAEGVGPSKAACYALICVASGLFGVSQGISNGPAQALLADSVPTGQRSKFYNWLFVSYIVPSLLGPVISVVYFEVKGNDWSMAALRDLMCLGLVLEVPVGLLSCLFRDDKALGAESDAVQDRRASDFSETPSGDFVSLTDVEDSKEGEPPKEGGPPAGAPETPAADEEHEKLAADPRVARVPYVVFATDLVVALGSGMTVKFFPLFFKNDCGMSPASVQGIYIAVPLFMACASTAATGLAKVTGRVQAVLLLRLCGLCCFGTMVVLFDRGFAAGHAKWAIVAFYVVRTALMNCTYPLEESILMDYVPKHTRARWKSLESVSMFGWCGSALAGGVLADKFGYTRTFLITIGLQGTGMLFYAQLLGIVAKEADLQKQAPPPDADLAAPLLAGDEPETSVQ